MPESHPFQSIPPPTAPSHGLSFGPVPQGPGANADAQPRVDPEGETAVETAREEPWTILVHNDDVTPYEFVVDTLGRIFSLSAEIAETVTWEAHSKGLAPVCSRPQSEAKRLISGAHAFARAAGYPLTFSMEPKS